MIPLSRCVRADKYALTPAHNYCHTYIYIHVFSYEQSSVDRHGSTSLLWAAGQGHLDVCRYLADECEVDPLDLHQTQKDGRNALHWAARNGKLGVCKWLVSDCKVPVDIQTFDGTSPFHWAVWQGHLPVCKWLVEEAGADKELRNSYGCNATHWASQQAVENIEMCRWLHADLRLDFGLINNNGHSALHKTALRGHALMTRWLVEEVRLDARHVQPDNDGDVPSKVARMEGFHELADWLVREEERLRDQPMQLD